MDAGSAPLNRRKILILEQDMFLASLLHMLLHREGFELRVITSEQNALLHINNQPPSELLFISHNLLKTEETSVLQHLKEDTVWQEVPVILLLNYYDENTIAQTDELGVNDYLVQPFDPCALLDLIQKYI
jgi:two-component system chemotaxis response regulator CheY